MLNFYYLKGSCMHRKYRKSKSVLLPIFIFAVIACAVIIMLIYSKGVRYIQTEKSDKFFGFLNKNNEVIKGKIWRSDHSVMDISEEKYFTTAFKPNLSGEIEASVNHLANAELASDASLPEMVDEINQILKAAGKMVNPVGDFMLNDESSEYFYVRETIEEFILKNEAAQNYISEAQFNLSDGTSWKIVTTKNIINSYKDFEIAKENSDSTIFKGTLIDFINKQDIKSGYISFENALYIMICRQRGTYRLDISNPKGKKDLYIGQIDHNFRKEGTGLYIFSTGDIYNGDFAQDVRTGQCSFKTNYSDYYAGGIKDGKKSGEGYYVWNDGTEYEGGFDENMKNGYGRYKYISGESYEGDYVDDVKHGKGVYTWANGDVYTGDFQDDARTGKGIYTWANGEMYEGDFKDNEMHGFGKYYWPSGRSYEAPFNKGKMTTEMPED